MSSLFSIGKIIICLPEHFDFTQYKLRRRISEFTSNKFISDIITLFFAGLTAQLIPDVFGTGFVIDY